MNLTEDGLVSSRPAGNEYTVKDDKSVLQFFYDHKDDDAETLTHSVCSNTEFWDEDMSKIPGFEAAVAGYLKAIEEKGAYEVMRDCL
jgi:tagaturonate reductase